MTARTKLECTTISNWWHNTEAAWEAMPLAAREPIAFAATGCHYAWPRWQAPVHCLHTQCRISRNEIKPIAMLNGMMKSEAHSGWWRFIKDRDTLARMYRHYRRQAFATQQFDLWKLVGTSVAMIGVMAK